MWQLLTCNSKCSFICWYSKTAWLSLSIFWCNLDIMGWHTIFLVWHNNDLFLLIPSFNFNGACDKCLQMSEFVEISCQIDELVQLKRPGMLLAIFIPYWCPGPHNLLLILLWPCHLGNMALFFLSIKIHELIN